MKMSWEALIIVSSVSILAILLETTAYATDFVPQLSGPSLTTDVNHTPQSPSTEDNVTFIANASSSDGNVTEIKIFIDGTLEKTCSSSQCEFIGGSYAEGSHTYRSEAMDNDNSIAMSNNKTFTVPGQSSPPENEGGSSRRSGGGSGSGSAPKKTNQTNNSGTVEAALISINIGERENQTENASNENSSDNSARLPTGAVINSSCRNLDCAIENARSLLSSIMSGPNALLILTGGLVLTMFLLPVAMIGTMFKRSQLEEVSDIGSIRSTDERKYELGFNAGYSINPQNPDDIIEMINYLEGVDAYIANSNGGGKKIRIENCRGCKGSSSSKPMCDFEKGFLAGAFSNIHKKAEVKETKCIAKGSKFCQFDVKTQR